MVLSARRMDLQHRHEGVHSLKIERRWPTAILVTWIRLDGLALVGRGGAERLRMKKGE